MAAVKYDVEDVESGGGGEEPQPGTYPGKIVSMVHRKKKSKTNEVISDFEITCDIGKEYVRLWTYVKLPDDPNYKQESHGWKLRELTDALGLPPKGSLDPAKITKQQPEVMVKVTSDTHQDTGEYRGKIKNLFPPASVTASDDGEATSDEGGPYGEEEISTWSEDDLKGYAEELGVDVPAGRGWKAKLISALVEAEEATGEEGNDNPPAATSSGESDPLSDFDEDLATEVRKVAEEGSDYISSWEDDDIKWFVDGLGLDTPVSGRGWKPKAVTAIADACAELVGGEGGEEAAADPDVPEAEPDDYEDVDDAGNLIWPDADLKAEIASRNEQGADIEVPRGRTNRAKLLELLRADDATATGKEPF